LFRQDVVGAEVADLFEELNRELVDGRDRGRARGLVLLFLRARRYQETTQQYG
jgi:hypothetical protein